MECKPVTLKGLNEHKKFLINFSSLNESKIRDIWYRYGDQYLNDFSNLKYNYNIPLYQKMIFRFREGYNKAILLFNGCDPCNKSLLINSFGFFNSDSSLIYFFVWIYCRLSSDVIERLEEDVSCDYVKKWKENEITFFFSLPENKQNELINNYNHIFDQKVEV